MSEHILAEVEVFAPRHCQIIPHATGGWTLTDVSRSGLVGDEDRVVDEFTLSGGEEMSLPPSVDDGHIERVFSFDCEHIFRISRPPEPKCACQCIEQSGCVVQDIAGDDDSVVLTFLVEGTETLRAVIEELEETGDAVSLRRHIEDCRNQGRSTPAILDRDALTTRQEEVLEIAYDMGYFEKPRGATA